MEESTAEPEDMNLDDEERKIKEEKGSVEKMEFAKS